MTILIRAEPGDAAVLEIGTGSGWTAGLLAHRLGSAVTSIEVDPQFAVQAAAALGAAGLRPAVVTGDGADGYRPAAPYDRVHVTCGIASDPPDWLRQCRPGAIIVAPWLPDGCGGHRLRLGVGADGSATGTFHGSCRYMMMRSQLAAVATARRAGSAVGRPDKLAADPGARPRNAAHAGRHAARRQPGRHHRPGRLLLRAAVGADARPVLGRRRPGARDRPHRCHGVR